MRALLLLWALLAHDDPGRDRYKNPKDLDGYIASQDAPDRATWQKPDQVLDALALRPGQVVCDIGAGTGYFALRAAKRIGEKGRVFAVDVEPRILDVLRARIDKTGVRNVTPVLAVAADPLLPPGGWFDGKRCPGHSSDAPICALRETALLPAGSRRPGAETKSD